MLVSWTSLLASNLPWLDVRGNVSMCVFVCKWGRVRVKELLEA